MVRRMALRNQGHVGAITGAIRTQHYTLDTGCIEHVVENLVVETREKVYRHNVAVELIARLQGQGLVVMRKGLAVVLNTKADFCQIGVIIALKSVEIIGTTLGRAVTAP